MDLHRVVSQSLMGRSWPKACQKGTWINLDGNVLQEAAESIWKGICLLKWEFGLLKSSMTKWPLSAGGGWSKGGVGAVLASCPRG